MRMLFCFLAVAFLCAAVFPLTLQEFKAAYFYANESVSFKALRAQGAYSLVLVDGKETGVFDSSAGVLVLEREKIAQILREDEYARADFEGTKAQAEQFWSLYYMSKKSGEETCNQYLGLDKNNCTDKVSYMRSCMSVPMCQPLVYVAGFIEGMQKWEGERGSISLLVDEFNAGIGEAFENSSALQEKGELLEKIIVQAAVVKNNALMMDAKDAACKKEKCFAFCPKPNYAEEEAGELAQKMLVVKGVMDGEGARVQRADGMQLKSTQLVQRSSEIVKQQPQESSKNAPCIPVLAFAAIAGFAFARE